MPPRFQADENLNSKIIAGLLRREPSVDFQTAKDAGIVGLPDHEVLAVASRDGRVLVSHDREAMPAHFSRVVCGFNQRRSADLVSQNVAIREVIEHSDHLGCFRGGCNGANRISYLPF